MNDIQQIVADLEIGEYIRRYDEPAVTDLSDSSLGAELLKRGLTLRADDIGLRVVLAPHFVLIETMPDYLRESHRAARNFGVYPRNGSVRSVMRRDEAEETVAADPDGYAKIVKYAEGESEGLRP